MNVAISIQHPSSVHFFKHPYNTFLNRGHNVDVYLREKGVASALLDAYNIEYTPLVGESNGSLPSLISTQLQYEYKLYKNINKKEYDVILERVGLAAAHVSALTPTVSIAFTDNKKQIPHRLAEPFLDILSSPKKLQESFNTNHKTYTGFKELAYLHPAVFEPSLDSVEQAGINPDSTYFILRASDFEAHHDVGKSGFSVGNFNSIIDLLSKEGDVYIIGGSNMDLNNRATTVNLPPHLIHDVLYYSDLCVADSKTLPTEAATLGTLSYRYDPFSDKNEYLQPLEDEFEILSSFSDQVNLINNIEKWVANGMATPSQNKIRKTMGERYKNVSDYIVSIVEQQKKNEKK
jgi:predicted glycosyltransferase